jgi:tetratricopeptide (TPR) repeat protein
VRTKDGEIMIDGDYGEKETFLADADSCIEQGLYQKAQDLAQSWLDKVPGDAEARVILCHAWTRMGKLDKVKQMLKEVDEAILGMSLIYARMGDICHRSGLNQEATAFYRKFVYLNPDSPLAIEVTAKLDSLLPPRREEDPSPLALTQEEEERPKQPLPGMQTVTMAELYVKQGHSELAVEVLRAILAKDKGNARAAAMLSKLAEPGETETRKPPYKKPDTLISELTRWLKNVDRIRGHAA